MADHSSPTKDFPQVEDSTAALLHALPDPALLIDADGTIRAVNAAAIAGSGRPEDELIGTNAYSHHDFSAITAGLERRIEEVIRSKKPLRTEGLHDGRRYDHSLYPVIDTHGTVTQIVSITKDITEERHAKEERQRLSKQVKKQERTFNGILSASDDRIYVFDKDMRYTYVNPPGARALGMAPKDIVGKTWKELGIPLEPMRRVTALADTVFATGRSQTGELHWDRADGTAQCYEYVHAPIFDSQSEVTSIVMTCRNITERKRAEDALHRESLIDAALAALYAPLVSPTATINEMTNAILDQARHLTSSEHGYVSLIDPETGNNVVYTFMQMMQEGQCDISSGEQKIIFPIGSDGRYPGLWGHVLNTKEAFFTNAPADHPASIGVPKGHVPLGRFLSVPTLIGEELVGQIALANSDREYTDQDLDAIQRLAEFYALAIVRMRMERGLQKAHDELEQKVEERTFELKNEIKERKVIEKELRATTKELQDNVEELRRAEQSVQEHARTVDILNRVIRAGNEADELQTMLSSMLDTAIELMEFDGGTIYSVGEAQHSIELQYQRGYSPEFVKRQLQRVSLTQKNIARIYKGKPLFSEDYVTDAVEGFNPGDIIARAAIPLIARDSVIGHYTLFSRRPHRFTPEERELLVTLGIEAATVIAKMQAEEEVKEQLRLIDLANDAIIIRDIDHHALSWNRGAERIFGWTKEEAIGRHVSTLLQTEFPVSFDDAREVLMRHGHWEGEMRCTTKNGARIVLYGSWTLKRDDAGNPTAILSIGNDVTERKEVEERLLAASLYSRNLLETSLDPLVTISAEGKITDVSRATEEVTGFSREQLIGSDFSTYFTKPEKARESYQKVFTEGSVRDYPLAIRHKSGRITDVLYNATVYRNEAGEIQGVFAAARDVTELKRAEKALKRAHDELEQKVKERTFELQEEIKERKVIEEGLRITTEELQELTEELRRSNKELEQFAYIASHDLQEPLRTVTSSLGLLESWYKGKLGAEADTFIGYAVDGTKHMQQLIKDLLEYSRVSTRGETFKLVSCEGVIQHAIDNLKASIEESEVKIMLPDKPLPSVMGDKTQLTQLFQNLIGNAIKFRSERQPEVQIGVEPNGGGNRWQFSIKDNGIGMDMQYADKIFTIFQRLHTTEQYQGTGVGLALCKKIVERHDGKIWVDSKLGKGTTFYFTLPFYVE